VGDVLQNMNDHVNFSIHAREEIGEIKDKSRIWFFLQAESEKEISEILKAE
jgi:hypothetical protein